MKTNNHIYSFYFSMMGNMRMPANVGYFFLIYGIVASLLVFGLGSVVGVVMFALGPVLFFLVKEHLVINFDTSTYRYAIDFLGFDFGPWSKLPPIEYVSVFAATYRSGSQGGDNSQVGKRMEVNLIYGKNQRLNVWIGYDKEDAIKAARYLAEHLGVKVLDASKKTFVWLEA